MIRRISFLLRMAIEENHRINPEMCIESKRKEHFHLIINSISN